MAHAEGWWVMEPLQQRPCKHCGKPIALTLEAAADGYHCWRSEDYCGKVAPFEARITELEADLAASNKRVAELEELESDFKLWRLCRNCGSTPGVCERARIKCCPDCTHELPQRPQDSEGGDRG